MTLEQVGNTILATIQSIGYLQFGVMLLVNVVLYRLHPVLGFLGTLFLFAILMGYLG